MTIRISSAPFALAIALSACTQARPQTLPVVAEERECPAFPAPPAALMEPPAKTDFLPRMR